MPRPIFKRALFFMRAKIQALEIIFSTPSIQRSIRWSCMRESTECCSAITACFASVSPDAVYYTVVGNAVKVWRVLDLRRDPKWIAEQFA